MRAVILAGGSGTRLWPESRLRHPKQFLALTGERSLFQQTIERVQPLVGEDLCVVTTLDGETLVRRQMEDLGIDPEGRVLFEPLGRNTAPAIGLAALYADPEEVLLVLSSDHCIVDEDAFRASLGSAAAVAADGHLVTFGISPASPETGYGYIRCGEPLTAAPGFRQVERFVEKPDLVTAKGYLADGNYVWNSGMFAFTAGTLLEELRTHAPDVWQGLETLRESLPADGRVAADLYGALPKISIDFAVMERSAKVVVLPISPGWSDLGSFAALYDLLPKGEGGNVVRPQGGQEPILIDSRDCLVMGSRRLVALVGMEDTVVVDTPDAVLVCPKERSQDVREVVARLEADNRPEAREHTTVHRPWGSFTTIDDGAGSKVKRIRVRPGARLSLQLHRHRAEHWVVVEGTALVTVGDRVSRLEVDQGIYIPVEAAHRLENPGTGFLEVVEVQIGTYLGEDDIVRLEDDYGRSELGS